MSKVMQSLAAVAALALAGAIHAQSDISKVNGAIRVDAGQSAGNLSTVNGSIRVAENGSAKHIETVNGGVRLGDGAQADSLETVNGAISIGAGSRIAGNVESVNGVVALGDGAEVAGDIGNVNGGVRMGANSSAASIETVSGHIDIGADARVLGTLTVKKPKGSWFSWGKSNDPRVVIGPRAEVVGPLVFERDVELFVHETARVGEISGATPVKFSGDKP